MGDELAARWLRRIGRRGASLAFVGLLSLVIGASLVIAGPEQLATPGFRVLASLAPLAVWAVAWFALGVLCLVQTFMRSDRIAFAAATALVLLYGLIFLSSTFTGQNPRGWVAGAVWLAFGGWIALIATWPEAAHVTRLPGAEGAAVVVADASGTILSWNPQAKRLFGWSTDEAVGQPLTVLMPARFRSQHDEGLIRVRVNGKSDLAGEVIPLVGLRRDGTEFPISLTINAWHTDDGITYTGVIRPLGGGRDVRYR
ncbi:PAS domain S-box protein [Actinomadura sp. ATCC 31491]|uniref:PAS domain S-box protein n=1 Tax=Actinomadura luzonensis TaxID=2805427 RepID=A0ABT0FQJ7_9ACTN|nr:PAS domain S-box protein [Actinomadura luzonensis]MCK2214428.1 PAS domain S-box protein [Actinomadura luzonensis]